MPTFRMPKFASIFALALLQSIHVSADCECGYSVNATTSPHYSLFTDLIESDFLHIDNIKADTDWQLQAYNVSAADSRGPYGKLAEVDNVVSNPLKNKKSFSGASTLGGDPGLQLIVRGGKPSNGLIPIAEVASVRGDMMFGSFRISMKLTNQSGTCGAFFFYFNNSQEIDLEFLSSQFNASASPVNLVLQSPASADAGFDAANTTTFDLYQLPFQPDAGFHEYRFDWTKDKVSFYADGQWLRDMSQAVPTDAGHITMSHWSNGDSHWSGGPPEKDAVLTVSYVKAYFNSSSPARKKDFSGRCKNPSAKNATCQIPDQKVAPDPLGPNGNTAANTFFFSAQSNMAVNQTVYRQSGSVRNREVALGLLLALPIALVLLSL
ncbi:MAG: hypothetical protein M1836_003769 [Candelina mexicana]|nr:MAG: hypothetical protein M1836_003769 [Candelina mexicana]